MSVLNFSGIRKWRNPAMFAVVAGVAIILVWISGNWQTQSPLSEDNIPLPFGQVSSNLAGRVDSTDIRGGKKLYTVSFDNDEVFEDLIEGETHFVLTPDSATISDGSWLAEAITPGKKIYGYKYTSRAATVEIDKQAELESGEPVEYKDRFPGVFFASDEQRTDSSEFDIAAWETTKEVTFLPLSEVTLEKNARYVVIAADEGIRVTARGLGWCGDGIPNGAEVCDDGNQTDGDLCSADCTCDHQSKLLEIADADDNGSLDATEAETVFALATEWLSSDSPNLASINDADCSGEVNEDDLKLLIDVAVINLEQ